MMISPKKVIGCSFFMLIFCLPFAFAQDSFENSLHYEFIEFGDPLNLSPEKQEVKAFQARTIWTGVLEYANRGDKTLHDINTRIEVDPPQLIPLKDPVDSLFGLSTVSDAINTGPLQAILLDPLFIDKLDPGEKKILPIRVLKGVDPRTVIPMDVIHEVSGQEVARETVYVNQIPKVAASHVSLNDDGSMDVYLVASAKKRLKKEIVNTSLLLTGAAVGSVLPELLSPIIQHDVMIEMNVKKAPSSNYRPSLRLRGLFEALFRGPKSLSADVLGPYEIDQPVLFGQRFKSASGFGNNNNVTFTFRNGQYLTAHQEHSLEVIK